MEGGRMSAVMAPAGWGWKAGTPMFTPAAERLPDLPLLQQVPSYRRGAVIVEALRSMPDIVGDLYPRDLVRKYGIPQPTASDVLSRAKT